MAVAISSPTCVHSSTCGTTLAWLGVITLPEGVEWYSPGDRLRRWAHSVIAMEEGLWPSLDS